MDQKVVSQRVTGLRRMTATEASRFGWMVEERPVIVTLDNGIILVPVATSDKPGGLIVKDILTNEWEVAHG